MQNVSVGCLNKLQIAVSGHPDHCSKATLAPQEVKHTLRKHLLLWDWEQDPEAAVCITRAGMLCSSAVSSVHPPRPCSCFASINSRVIPRLPQPWLGLCPASLSDRDGAFAYRLFMICSAQPVRGS